MLIWQWSGQRSLKSWYEITMKHLHGIELLGMKINDVTKLIC